MPAPITLDGRSLSIADVVAVARHGAPVAIAAAARQGIEASRRVVEEAVTRGDTIYGVNTGFGKLAHVRIPPDRIRALRLAHPRRVAADEVELQRADTVRGDAHVRQLPKARVHPVDRVPTRDRFLHRAARRLDPLPRRGRDRHRGPVAGDRHHVRDREGATVELDGRWHATGNYGEGSSDAKPRAESGQARVAWPLSSAVYLLDPLTTEPVAAAAASPARGASSGFPRSVWKLQSKIAYCVTAWVTRSAP